MRRVIRALGVAAAFAIAVVAWPLLGWALGGFEYSEGGVPGLAAGLLGRLILIALNLLVVFGPVALLAFFVSRWLERRKLRAGRARSSAEPSA